MKREEREEKEQPHAFLASPMLSVAWRRADSSLIASARLRLRPILEGVHEKVRDGTQMNGIDGRVSRGYTPIERSRQRTERDRDKRQRQGQRQIQRQTETRERTRRQ